MYLNSGIVVGGISGAPVEQGQRLLINALHPFMLHNQKTSIMSGKSRASIQNKEILERLDSFQPIHKDSLRGLGADTLTFLVSTPFV